MPTTTVNDVRLFFTLTGDAGPPLVLVHGSWGDHTGWDLIVPALSERFRVLAYDRRGHGQSERPTGQGSAEEDATDLAALIEALDLGPAHVVGNSFGASIALRLAARRPDLVRSLAVHEPPLLDVALENPDELRAAQGVKDRIEAVATRLAAGDTEGGTRNFFDTVALGPGTWDTFPPEMQQVFLARAPTFLDEARDPEAYAIDLGALSTFAGPALVTHGDQSLTFYAPIARMVAAALPRGELRVLQGVGHVPHATHPEEYIAVIAAFVDAADTG